MSQCLEDLITAWEVVTTDRPGPQAVGRPSPTGGLLRSLAVLGRLRAEGAGWMTGGKLTATLGLAFLVACEPAADTTRAAPTPEDVAGGLRPALQLEGQEPTVYSLEDRMAFHDVPGVSVAVLDEGRVAWARGWGVADTETGAPVTPTTLFQAASISKPVAALAAMSLTEEGELTLDDPVNDDLTTWQVPANEFTPDSAVTLRGLLSHTAGLTVWGFPGYPKDRPFADGREIATNVDVLDGRGNTDPVRVFREPGTAWLYSGGGYTVVEQLLEDVTGRPFPDIMRDRVLASAGMSRSTYEQPLPEERWPEAARGHGGDGSEVEGEWHNYPEQAAAGLWTTPSDLLALSRHLLSVLDGTDTEGVVGRETLDIMLTPHRGDEEGFERYGLGFGVEGEGPARTFGHGGSNEGFRAQWVVFREGGQGAVVMTNGAGGGQLAAEILRSIAVAYDWPRLQPETRATRPLAPEELAPYEGRYELESNPEVAITVRAGEGVLLVTVPDQGTSTLHAEPDAPDAFFRGSDGESATFERDGGGAVVALVLQGGDRLVRR